jgi:hypothetical protein
MSYRNTPHPLGTDSSDTSRTTIEKVSAAWLEFWPSQDALGSRKWLVRLNSFEPTPSHAASFQPFLQKVFWCRFGGVRRLFSICVLGSPR